MKPNCFFRAFGVLFAAVLFVSFAFGQTNTPPAEVSVQKLLPQMRDLSHLARRPVPFYTLRQASSYDRKSTSDTPHTSAAWFANGDFGQFVRVAISPDGTRKEYVLADLTGPGAVVRVWSANPGGTLRFYFDGEKTPRLSASMDYLLKGRIAPFVPPFAYSADVGRNLYFPLPYAQRLLVTVEYEGGIPDEASRLYYHVGYRAYAPNTPVRTFTLADLTDAATIREMARVTKELTAPAPPPGVLHTQKGVLSSHGSFVLPLVAQNGGSAVTQLRVRVPVPKLPANTPWKDARQMHNVLRNLILTATFDGEETVRAPLGDFFASGVGLNAGQTLPMSITPDGTLTCRFVMPFRQHAQIKIENRTAPVQALTIEAITAPFAWDAATYTFHAEWSAEKSKTRPQHDMTFFQATGGEGVLVGAAMGVANPVPDWWGEGDEKIYRDGETFPGIFGTGSEDYFGYAWSSPHLFTAPYHAQIRCDGPGTMGHVSVQRWHILDAIPWEKSLRFDMELWHAKDTTATVTRTVYWYAKPGTMLPAALNTALLAPPEIVPPTPVKGAVEGESLFVAQVTGGKVLVQDGFSELSGGKQKWWVNPAVGDKLVFVVMALRAGDFRIVGKFCFAPDYGVHQLRVNGQAAGSAIDFYHAGAVVWQTRDLGVFALKAGRNALEVECVGANAKAAAGNMFGLDYLLLRPVNAK